jgi:F-type H+-transporting ATPase subunit c
MKRFWRFDRVQSREPSRNNNHKKGNIMLMPMLAEMSGSIHVGLAGLGSAIGVGLVGMKASEAVGRNPGAFGKVITLAVLGMALAEAIVFYALFLVQAPK